MEGGVEVEDFEYYDEELEDDPSDLKLTGSSVNQAKTQPNAALNTHSVKDEPISII